MNDYRFAVTIPKEKMKEVLSYLARNGGRDFTELQEDSAVRVLWSTGNTRSSDNGVMWMKKSTYDTVAEMIRRRRKIEAIRHIRDSYGDTLMVAKAIMEGVERMMMEDA